MSIPITRAEAKAARGVFLLDLSWAGGELSVATKPVTVTDKKGTVHVYESGLGDLEVSMAEAIDSVSISLTLPEAGWLDGFRRGYPLDQMRGTLSRYYIGTGYESRRVLVEGALLDVVAGVPGQEDTISAQLSQTAAVDHTFPDRVVTLEAFSGIGSTPYDMESKCPSLGSVVPIIFGAPGRFHFDASIFAIQAVPALELTLEEENHAARCRWLIAGHHLTGFAINSLVRPTSPARLYSGTARTDLATATTAVSNSLMLHNTTDHLGNDVAFLDNNQASHYGSLSNEDVYSGREFWIGFANSDVGGLSNPYRDGILDGCSDVIRYLLERYSGRQIDLARMETYAADLNNLKIDAVINAPTTVTAWIDSLSKSYPIRVVQGPDGIYVRRRRYTADASQAVAALAVKGQSGNIGVSRASGLTLAEDEICNQIRIDYAFRFLTDANSSVTVGSSDQDRAPLTGTGAAGLISRNITGASRLAESSQASYGVREKVIKASTCWDESTAASIGVAMAERYALPRYLVTYQGDRALETLNPGDVVTIADPDLTDTTRIAIVDDVIIGSRQPSVVLELVSDPIAWAVTAG